VRTKNHKFINRSTGQKLTHKLMCATVLLESSYYQPVAVQFGLC